MRSLQLITFKYSSVGRLWRVSTRLRKWSCFGPQWDWRRSNLTYNLAFCDPLCCLKCLWNVEQIPSALSAWARSPLARLKSQRPARELTEFHMEARNRGTSCLSLTACPTLALICRCPVYSLLSCLAGCVFMFENCNVCPG